MENVIKIISCAVIMSVVSICSFDIYQSGYILGFYYGLSIWVMYLVVLIFNVHEMKINTLLKQ